MSGPDRNTLYPLKVYDRLCFLKNIITNPNVTSSYISKLESGD